MGQTYVEVTEKPISLEDVSKKVRDDGAGAIATFEGTTRDHFQGKKVLKLEYEAYEPMARKEMEKIAQSIREKWDVLHIAMFHRV
jgi:molybdopterin synthase catalytic subunit